MKGIHQEQIITFCLLMKYLILPNVPNLTVNKIYKKNIIQVAHITRI